MDLSWQADASQARAQQQSKVLGESLDKMKRSLAYTPLCQHNTITVLSKAVQGQLQNDLGSHEVHIHKSRADANVPSRPSMMSPYSSSLSVLSLSSGSSTSSTSSVASTKNTPRSAKRSRQRTNQRNCKEQEARRRQLLRTPSPDREECKNLLRRIRSIIRPKRVNRIGHLPFHGDELLRTRLELLESMLEMYTSPRFSPDRGQTLLDWIPALQMAAQTKGYGLTKAESMRRWARDMLEDPTDLPINLYGSWNESMLEQGELADKLKAHLTSIGKNVTGRDVAEFLDRPEVQAKHGLAKSVSVTTGDWWLGMMNIRWTRLTNGQFVDGHECEDVVTYCRVVYVPAILQYLLCMQQYIKDKDGEMQEALDSRACPLP
jgi:hypothetical protein